MPWFLQSLLGFTKSQGPQSFRLGNQPHAQNPDFFGGRVSDITRVAADGIILADGVAKWPQCLHGGVRGFSQEIGVVTLHGARLFYPDERVGEFLPLLRQHWAAHER